MTEKQSDTKETPIEELQCHKKYVYDTGIIFECKNNCKSEIIGEDVVRLLNELATKCSQLKKENEQLKKALRELLEEYGNSYYIDLFDKLFNLEYREWYNSTAPNNEPYVDWEKIAKEKELKK